jgi:hypothetical protein
MGEKRSDLPASFSLIARDLSKNLPETGWGLPIVSNFFPAAEVVKPPNLWITP